MRECRLGLLTRPEAPGLRTTIDLPQPSTFGFTAAEKRIPMTSSLHNSAPTGGNSLSVTSGSYFARYRMALYLFFAAATSLSVALNWNWLTAVEVFRIMASFAVPETRDLQVKLKAALLCKCLLASEIGRSATTANASWLSQMPPSPIIEPIKIWRRISLPVA
jgi:hypothetical protein